MRNIKNIVNSDAAYEILDNSNCAGSTWAAGGCAILAQALNNLEGYPIYVIYNKEHRGAEHFGAMTPSGVIIDADGEHNNTDAWLKFFKENEHPRPGKLVVIPYDSDVDMEGINFDDKASSELAKLIKNHQMVRETVRGVLRESVIGEEVIEETQTGQKDLEKFTNDILKFLGERVIKERDHNEFLDPSSPELRYLPMLFTGKMTGEGYNEIGEFVDETSIKVYPTQALPEGTDGSLGYASAEQTGHKEVFQISLRYSDRDLADINKLFKEQENVDSSDVYFRLYYMFYSTLLHELQHAYDAWRSKGKAFGSQLDKGFIKRRQDAKSLASSKKLEDLTPEETDAINKSFKEYQNLVHEINARYAQAMHRVRMTSVDSQTLKRSVSPWEDVYGAFKSEFDGWRNLSDKMKKKLVRRLAKAYSESSD